MMVDKHTESWYTHYKAGESEEIETLDGLNRRINKIWVPTMVILVAACALALYGVVELVKAII